MQHTIQASPTRKRTTKTAPLNLPVFLDAQDREYHHLPLSYGRPVDILKRQLDAIRPYLTTGKFMWNHDNQRDEDGKHKRFYPKTTAYEPGRRRRGKSARARYMPLARLVIMAEMHKRGIKLPRKGWEVAYIDATLRHDIRPENLKIRPRSENKNYVAACVALDPSFDPATGFDLPCNVLAALNETLRQ